MTGSDDQDGLDPELLSAWLGDEAPAPEVEDNPRLTHAVNAVLDALLGEELVELDEDRRPNLVAELCAVVGEARSPKDFAKRFVRTIVDSEHVEEVYGTDDTLRDVVRAAMGE